MRQEPSLLVLFHYSGGWTYLNQLWDEEYWPFLRLFLSLLSISHLHQSIFLRFPKSAFAVTISLFITPIPTIECGSRIPLGSNTIKHYIFDAVKFEWLYNCLRWCG